MKGLVDIRDLSEDEVWSILEIARGFSDRLTSGERQFDSLVGRLITTAFFEPSTRTRFSFEVAARFLGAHVMNFDIGTSSTAKGESLADSARTLSAIGTDLFVVRHRRDDGPDVVARATGVPVISGGAGTTSHPTQTLADLLTITDRFESIEGLRLGVVGDIANSRVAAGLMHALPFLGAHVELIAPPPLLPVDSGLTVHSDFDEALTGLDIVYLLRIQKERGAETGYASDHEYSIDFGMTPERLSRLPKTSYVMHAGPMNRGVEISDEVADGDRCLATTQVAMGVPVRMAVLVSCLGKMRS